MCGEEASALCMTKKTQQAWRAEEVQLKQRHDNQKQQQEPKQQPHAQSDLQTKQNERKRYQRSNTPMGLGHNPANVILHPLSAPAEV